MRAKLPSKKNCIKILQKIWIFNADGQFPILEKIISREKISEIINEAESTKPTKNTLDSSNCIVLSHQIGELRKRKNDFSGSPDDTTIEEFLHQHSPPEKDVLRMATFALLGIAMILIRKNEESSSE